MEKEFVLNIRPWKHGLIGTMGNFSIAETLDHKKIIVNTEHYKEWGKLGDDVYILKDEYIPQTIKTIDSNSFEF